MSSDVTVKYLAMTSGLEWKIIQEEVYDVLGKALPMQEKAHHQVSSSQLSFRYLSQSGFELISYVPGVVFFPSTLGVLHPLADSCSLLRYGQDAWKLGVFNVLSQ